MSEQKIPIPARLYNAAVNGHVAGTEDIIDDSKNKTQKEINTETDNRVENLESTVSEGGSIDERIATEGAKHYLKSETYTKEEVHNLITTPNQEYVSVTATDQTTAVTDVLPATGAADTVYRVGNWDGTQYNESLYTEYAWNGSAYVPLSVKSQIGEIYDISLNHAGATYADLAAALGTNGANIPVSLRKGGMSVKFVQSSDNKYAQYRLVSQEFTITQMYWQKQGEEIILTPKTIVEDKYIRHGNGNTVDYNGLNYVEFPILEKCVIRYRYTYSSPDARGLAFYDASGNYISGVQVATTEQYIEAPSNASLVRATCINVDDADIDILLGGFSGNIDKPLSTKDCLVEYSNEIIISRGKYYNALGELRDYENSFSITNKIYLPKGDYSVKVCDGQPSGNQSLIIYTFDGNFDRGIRASSGTYNSEKNASYVEIEIPSEGGFIACSISTAYSDKTDIQLFNWLDLMLISPTTNLRQLVSALSLNGYIDKTLSLNGSVINSNGINIIRGKYYNAIGELKDYSGSYSATEKFYIPAGTYKIKVCDGQPSGNQSVVIFKLGGEFESGTRASSGVYDSVTNASYVELVIPSGGRLMAFSITTNYADKSDKELFDWAKLTLLTEAANLRNTLTGICNAMKSYFGTVFYTDEVPLQRITERMGFLNLFLNVGCIGDSLASGECISNETGSYVGHDLYEYSWGQFLARLTGNKYYNWSSGGKTTRSWLASQYATECYDGEHLCQAYIIGLGQNDYNESIPVGTIDDIDLEDYNNNEDTYYGNYGKIIQKVLEINPKAKLFLLTDMNNATESGGYNTAVRNIVTLFPNNTFLLDFREYGMSYYSGVLAENMRASHFNAYGYYICALMIANYIDWVIQKNQSKFRQVEFIGTPYSYN